MLFEADPSYLWEPQTICFGVCTGNHNSANYKIPLHSEIVAIDPRFDNNNLEKISFKLADGSIERLETEKTFPENFYDLPGTLIGSKTTILPDHVNRDTISSIAFIYEQFNICDVFDDPLVTCRITDFSLAPLSNITMPLSQTYTGHTISASILPTHCECLNEVQYSFTYVKNNQVVMSPAFVRNNPATSGMFVFEGQSQSDAGSYTVYVTAEYPRIEPVTGITWATTTSFTLDIEDDTCETTAISFDSALLNLLNV